MTTMAANAGGTAMTLYLVNMRVSMLAFMGTFDVVLLHRERDQGPDPRGAGLPQCARPFVRTCVRPVILVGALLGYVIFDG